MIRRSSTALTPVGFSLPDETNLNTYYVLGLCANTHIGFIIPNPWAGARIRVTKSVILEVRIEPVDAVLALRSMIATGLCQFESSADKAA